MKSTLVNNEEMISVTPLLNFLKDSIRYRLSNELLGEELAVPELYLDRNDSNLSKFIQKEKLNQQEIILLLLAIVPHIMPNFLTNIVSEFLPNGGEFPEFGGIKGKNHRGILPTA
ncbi:MAG: ATP-binding protein, partial [Flavobacteriaceae bacterium]|nr:ATP-binding protein [Flavobacteriaceae bacterium]